jgi:hypothetical protein
MKKLVKLDFKHLAEQLNLALWFLGEHAFAGVLFFVLAAALIAGVLFWQYVIFSPQPTQEGVISEFAFQKELFENLLSELEQEKTRVREANFLAPRDLFNP